MKNPPPFHEFEDIPSQHIDIPDGMFNVSCRTSEGKLVTFLFTPYREGGPPQCVDIHWQNSPTVSPIPGRDYSMGSFHILGHAPGGKVPVDSRKQAFPIVVATLLIDLPI